MNTLYFELNMGAAGDMLTAALCELTGDVNKTVDELNKIGIPGVIVAAEKSIKCGITGTHISIKVNGTEEDEHLHDHGHHHKHVQYTKYKYELTGIDSDHDAQHLRDHIRDIHDIEGVAVNCFAEMLIFECEASNLEHTLIHIKDAVHHSSNTGKLGDQISASKGGEYHVHSHHGHSHSHSHNGLKEVQDIISKLNVSEKVKQDALNVYTLIAEAESHAHNMPVSDIHFHEVGTFDAIADVVNVCYLMEKLSPDKVIASPVHVGSGTVKCAHGILPVPAPATEFILHNVPIYSGSIKGELCTPTGAALLKYFVTEFASMPVMSVSATGYGMGKKDFEAANCVRAMLGTDARSRNIVVELSCNVDDMTGERIGYAMDKLFENGAVEVFTIPIGMKKCRPGILLNVQCRESDKEKIISTIFKYTTTIGIRQNISERFVLSRRIETRDTKFGPVRVKLSTGYGVNREKYEYDDLSRIADETGLSIEEIIKELDAQ